MNRIKQVLWERRIAHLQAAKIFASSSSLSDTTDPSSATVSASNTDPLSATVSASNTDPLSASLEATTTSTATVQATSTGTLSKEETEEIARIGRKKSFGFRFKSLTKAKRKFNSSWTVV